MTKSPGNGLGRYRNELAKLYDLVHQAILPDLQTDQQKFADLLAIVQNVKHLVIGANSLNRLYPSQMFRELRGSAASTAIAKLILNDYTMYEIFSKDREKDPAARSGCKSDIQQKIIFGDSDTFEGLAQDVSANCG